MATAEVYAYSPYGEATALGPDGGNSLQYTGRENDGTGLFYYRARYYDPVLKQFVSEDPVGMTAGPNFYAYANGDPASFTDPDGLMGNSPGGGGRATPGPVRFAGGGAKPGFCGTGSFGEAVTPDSWGPYRFSSACKKHDACYETCGASKVACDLQFRRDLLKECRAKGASARGFCASLAVDYAVAVDTLGTKAFNDAQSTCSCKPQ